MGSRLLSPSLTFGTYDTAATHITNGHKIFIQSRRGQVYANDAKIIDGDIMALNGAIHVLDTVLFTDLNQSEPNPEQTSDLYPKPDTIMPFEPISDNPEPNLEPNSKPNTQIFDSWKLQQIQQRSEMRMKRAISPISTSRGKNCGTKPGPQPRHITASGNEGPKFGPEKFRPLGRNSLGTLMKNKELYQAFEKLLG